MPMVCLRVNKALRTVLWAERPVAGRRPASNTVLCSALTPARPIRPLVPWMPRSTRQRRASLLTTCIVASPSSLAAVEDLVVGDERLQRLRRGSAARPMARCRRIRTASARPAARGHHRERASCVVSCGSRMRSSSSSRNGACSSGWPSSSTPVAAQRDAAFGAADARVATSSGCSRAQDARGQRLRVVAGQDRHARLRDHRAAIQLRRDEMHAGAVLAHAGIERAARAYAGP